MEGDIGSDFIRLTKYQLMEGESDQDREILQPPLQISADPESRTINLPDPAQIKLREVGLRETIERRRSVRKYSPQPLSLADLSWLLWVTQGVRKIYPEATLRNVPSAGSRHALETYLAVKRVTGLRPGLYRFVALTHQIQAVDLDKSLNERLYTAGLKQRMIHESALTFIWVAVPYRMTWRYQERGYRYLFLDAGHACQNLYLAAPVVECGICAIAAFDDDKVNTLLGVDGKEMFALYLAAIGKT